MRHVLKAAVALAAGVATVDVPAQQKSGAVVAEAIVVTASRSATPVDEMPLYTTVVTQEEIRRSPARTLDQLLRNVPGLNFTGVPAVQSDPTGHQTRMRGLGNAKVLMLLDGIPIHDPFYLTTQFYKVPLSNVERIEVVRGGNSSLWGNMAVAGVINIVTRRVRDDSGEAGASIDQRGSAGASVVKNFKLSGALGVNIAIDELNWNGYQVTPAESLWRFPQKRPVDARNTNLQMTAFLKAAEDLKGYLRVGYHIQDQDISYQFGNNLQRNPDASAGLTWTLDERSQLQGNAWAQYVRFEKYNGATCYFNGALPAGTGATQRCPSNANVTPARINDNSILQYHTQYGSQRYREQGGSLYYSRELTGQWRGFQVGVDARRLTASDLEFFYNAPTAFAAPQGNLGSSTYGEAKQLFTGVFAQAKVVPLDPLELTFSARHDRWENSDRVNLRKTAAGALSGGAQADTTRSALNPSAAFKLNLTDSASLRGAAYRSFRAPGFNNTTRTFGATTPTIANPDLGPENLRGMEIGADLERGPWRLSATAYQYDIRNMIATFRVNSFATAPLLVQTICGAALANCGGSANFYTNDQDGRSRGAELAARWKVSDNLALDVTYTRTETYLTRRGSIVTDPLNVQLAGTPKNLFGLSADWRPAGVWRLYGEMRYVGRMYVDTTSTAGVRYEQGGATVVNATASYALDRRTDLSAGVINLFDKEYSEGAYPFNQPFNRTLSQRRTATVALKARF